MAQIPEETINSVVKVFEGTFTPDTQLRNQAEEQLRQFQKVPGFVSILLQITISPSINHAIRLVACIYMKNMVRSSWITDPEEYEETQTSRTFLSAPDKEFIQSHLLSAIISCYDQSKIMSSLVECLKLIVRWDFPENWPGLFETIQSHLSLDSDFPHLYGALRTLRVLVREYQYKSVEMRQPQYAIVSAVFPTLATMMQSFLTQPSEASGELVKIICKIFWSCTSSHMAPSLLDTAQFSTWLDLLVNLLSLPVIEPTAPVMQNGMVVERSEYPWWKCKKWVSAILYRLYERYGNPKFVPHEGNGESGTQALKHFAQWFSSQCSIPLLTCMLNVLRASKNDGFVPRRVLTNCFNYLDLAVRQASTFKHLRPHLDELLFEILFPILCYSQTDLEMWESNPYEYIRLLQSLEEHFNDPRLAAIAVLTSLTKLRKKHTLDKFLSFLASIMNEYQAAPEQNQQRKSGVLRAIGALAMNLYSQESYAAQIEPMLIMHVYPDLRSSHPILRGLACWTFSQYSDVEFQQVDGFRSALHGIFSCLEDENLPVKYSAATAFCHLVDKDATRAEILPILNQLFDRLFDIMEEVGSSEELMDTIEKMVESCDEAVLPFALKLCTKLSIEFERLFSEADDDDEAAMTCVGILRTLITLLGCVPSQHPTILRQMEPILLPLLQRCLSEDSIEFLEDVLEVVALFTYKSPNISHELWTLFPQIIHIFNEFAYDYIADIVPPLDNFMTRDPITFATSTQPNYIEMILSTVSTCIERADTNNSHEAQEATKLLESAFQNTKDKANMSGVRMPCIQMLLQGMAKYPEIHEPKETVGHHFGILAANALSSIVFNHPAETLQMVDAAGLTGKFFEAWLGMMPFMPRFYDQKASAIALLSIFALELSEIPASLQPMLTQLVPVLLGVMEKYYEVEMQKAKQQTQEEEEEEEDDDAFGFGELADEEDENDQLDEEYIQQLREALATFEDGTNLEEDEDVVDTILDVMDAFVVFTNVFQNNSKVNIASLSAHDQEKMQHCMSEGQKRMSSQCG